MILSKVSQGGRVVIPVEYRQQLGIKEGDEVLLDFKDGQIVLTTRQQQLLKAQQIVRRYVAKEGSMVQDLLAQRRSKPEQD